MEHDIMKIRALCDRYFDGVASPDEEFVLRSYFTQAQDIPEDLKAVKVMVCGMNEASRMSYVPTASRSLRTDGKIRRIVWSTVAAAASVAICISLLNREVYGYDSDGKAITDPQIALESTALLAHLSKLETTIDIAEMITQGMENNN